MGITLDGLNAEKVKDFLEEGDGEKEEERRHPSASSAVAPPPQQDHAPLRQHRRISRAGGWSVLWVEVGPGGEDDWLLAVGVKKEGNDRRPLTLLPTQAPTQALT